ncbi:hypothetical protein OQA88_13606 [Cercophora sp. LCS_1]
MVTTSRHIVGRAELADPRLDTGAIAGIACAVGALLLGAIGLFIIYWRRQKQYEREDRIYHRRPIEENPLAASSPPIYTHDYKMKLDSTVDGSASSYAYSAEFPKDSPFSGSDSVSAMPTHHAYIPRALVRPSASTTLSSTPESTPRSQMSLQPPPPPRALRKSRPDDIVMQAYLRAADGERVPSEVFRFAAPPAAPPPAPQMIPSSSLPLRNLTAPAPNPRRAQPTLTIDTGHDRRPIARRDEMEITAPMGLSPPKQTQAQFQPFQQRYRQFRQQTHPVPLEEHSQFTMADRRTFRDRAQPGHQKDESASKRISTWMAGQPYIEQNAHRYQTTQVPPDSDVW